MGPPDTNTDLLFYKIQLLRNKMIYLGNSKGLTHPETIKCSEDLDKMILKYLTNQK